MSPAQIYVYDHALTQWRAKGRTAISGGDGGGSGTVAQPVRANSGWVAAGSPTLTAYAPGIKTEVNGLVLENRSVAGDLEFADGCTDVTVRNCVIAGSLKFREVTGVVVEYTDAEAFILDGTHNAEVAYCYVTGAVNTDGFQVKGDGGAVPTDVHIHHNFVGNASTTADGHYDGVQVRGVNGLTIEYNNFDPGPTFDDNQNVCLFMQDANGGNWNVTIRGNWISAMGYGLLMIHVRNPITIVDNTFYADPMSGSIVKGTVTGTIVQSGNKWSDGTPIPDILAA